MTALSDVIQRGTTVAQPAAGDVPIGTLYFDTTLSKLQRSTGAAWEDCEGAGGGGGASSFTALDDVPDSYAGQGGKAVYVRADASGLEFL